MTWTVHYGYLNPNDTIDTTVFVKENDRSYIAVAIFNGKSRSVYKKDKDKLFNRLSDPKILTKNWISNFVNPKDKALKGFMLRIFEQNNHTREIKNFLEGRIKNDY